jgi:putative salt-induced outer membrane protein YdiY
MRGWYRRFGANALRKAAKELGIGPSLTGPDDEHAVLEETLRAWSTAAKSLPELCRQRRIPFHVVPEVNGPQSLRLCASLRCDYGIYSGAGSALQLGEHRQLTASLRYERDDFATYDRLATIGIGYGTRIMDGDRKSIDVQIGPGVRRAHDVDEDRTETGLIGRGLVDFKYGLTTNTELVNTLLVESGSYNTFAQDDLGISVSMNSRLALKAGWQARHNSDVSDDKKKTDTLTTMNVVYKFK